MQNQGDPSDRATGRDKARTKPGAPGRDARLKAALKANMARRKEQARARGAEDAPGHGGKED